MRILFVCTGNSCRSPMAEIYFNALMKQRGRDDISAVSAGLCAVNGWTVSNQAHEVMRRFGLDASGFRSTAFTAQLAGECDMIIGMSASHVMAIKKSCPEIAGRVSLLLSCCGKDVDVPDPYGGSVEHYAEVFSAMREALDALAEKVCK